MSAGHAPEHSRCRLPTRSARQIFIEDSGKYMRLETCDLCQSGRHDFVLSEKYLTSDAVCENFISIILKFGIGRNRHQF